MSEYHDREVLNAGKLGTYRVHSLLTRISSDGDMEPDGEDPFPGAVSLHAHEYTHYLHNLSTTAGLEAMLACFWLVVPFVNNTDERGWYSAPLDSQTAESENLALAFKVMINARGSVDGIPADETFKWPVIEEWTFGDLRSETVPLSHAFEGHIGTLNVKSLSVTAKSKSSKFDLTLRPGLDFISEGVAYEIEREQRRLAGIPVQVLDAHTPSYPYLAYRPLIEHFVGHETTIYERVLLGNFSLLSHHVADTFFELCSALKSDKLKGDAQIAETISVAGRVLEKFRENATRSNGSHADEIKSILAGSADLYPAVELYGRLIEKGLQLRLSKPLMEHLFAQKHLSPEEFRNVTVNLLERQICQEKSDGSANIEWVGALGSVADLEPGDHHQLAVLQAAIHYLQQHFRKSGQLANTGDLEVSACPYRGACEAQKKFGNPPECDTKPWLVSVADGKREVCFYEAARLSLRLDRRAKS